MIILCLVSVLILVGKLKLFYVIGQAGQVFLLTKDDNKPVSGATVVLDATEDSFHLLGDVANGNQKGSDGKIDGYDSNLMNQQYSKQIYDSWFDLNKDGTIDLKDVYIVSQDIGLVWHEPPVKSQYTTGINGNVTINVVKTNLDCAYNYVVNVSYLGVIKPIIDILIDVRQTTTIYADKCKPPIAIFTYFPKEPNAGEPITFDASASYDPDGSIVKYEWDFTGDGITDITGMIVTWSYGLGWHAVKLIVTDIDSLTASQTQTVDVYYAYPVAKIATDKTSGLSPLTVNFDASASYDPDGGTVKCNWDFGDGTTTSGVKVSHTFILSSEMYYNYTVKLTVIDDEGLTALNSVNIYVYSKTGFASFTYSPTYPYMSELITFDGSISKPCSGAIIIEYHWKFDDVEMKTTTQTVKFSFTTSGTHITSLYIVDSTGFISQTISQEVNVIEYPTASFTIIGEMYIGKQLEFRSTSKGAISKYSWSFGDGGTSSDNPATHVYTTEGNYTVKLEITDVRRTTVSTQETISIVIEPPILTLLTSLKFPPSSQVEIKIQVNDKTSGNPIIDKDVTLKILSSSEVNYPETTVTKRTDSSGVATFTIMTPSSSLYTYPITFSCCGTTKNYVLEILPQIQVKIVGHNSYAIYKPGDYDFIFTGQIVDNETGDAIYNYSLSFKELKDEQGNIVDSTYMSYMTDNNYFTFKARVYDYFVNIDPAFKYQNKKLTLTLKFEKSDYVSGTICITVEMVSPPTAAYIGSNSITIGANSINITYLDQYGKPHSMITESNVEVVITTPGGFNYSTLNQLAGKYTFDYTTKTMTVNFDFNEPGTYKVTVNYIGMQVESQSFEIKTTQNIFATIFNPYVLGAIIVVVALTIIFLIRRRK